MQRKAESARVARLRKKEYVTGLEDQIKDLQSALAAAQATNAGCGSGATPAAPAVPTEQGLREEGQRELSHMDALLRQPNLDRLEVNATVERYVANKRAQHRTANELLDSIEDILSPAAPLQVAFNNEAGDDAFASAAAAAAVSSDATTTNTADKLPTNAEDAVKKECGNGGASGDEVGDDGEEENGEGHTAKRQRRESVGSQLMGTLARELGLNAAQVAGLSEQKHSIRADREIVADCMRQIRGLRQRVAEHVQSSQRVTDELRRILEPTQVARFLLWVERNQRSMNLLNSIVAVDAEE